LSTRHIIHEGGENREICSCDPLEEQEEDIGNWLDHLQRDEELVGRYRPGMEADAKVVWRGLEWREIAV